MLYLSTLAMSGDNAASSARDALRPAVSALLQVSAQTTPNDVRQSRQITSLFYTERADETLEVWSMSSRLSEPLPEVSESTGERGSDNLGIAEVCDAAVEEAERLFRRITGEAELFDASQDDGQAGDGDDD